MFLTEETSSICQCVGYSVCVKSVSEDTLYRAVLFAHAWDSDPGQQFKLQFIACTHTKSAHTRQRYTAQVQPALAVIPMSR